MATKIKNDLKEEYQGIKYILTSTMRTKLLLSIYNGSKNLDDLRIELEKPSATILHGLKELENFNYENKLEICEKGSENLGPLTRTHFLLKN